MFIIGENEEKNLKSERVQIITNKKQGVENECGLSRRYQDQLILCCTFNSHCSYTATFPQSSLPHT